MGAQHAHPPHAHTLRTPPHPHTQRLGGFFALRDLLANTGWAEPRAREALARMLREGLLLVDDPPPGVCVLAAWLNA